MVANYRMRLERERESEYDIERQCVRSQNMVSGCYAKMFKGNPVKIQWHDKKNCAQYNTGMSYLR